MAGLWAAWADSSISALWLGGIREKPSVSTLKWVCGLNEIKMAALLLEYVSLASPLAVWLIICATPMLYYICWRACSLTFVFVRILFFSFFVPVVPGEVVNLSAFVVC